jgi:hypothetical protein
MVAYNGQISVISIYDTLPSQNKTQTQNHGTRKWLSVQKL